MQNVIKQRIYFRTCNPFYDSGALHDSFYHLSCNVQSALVAEDVFEDGVEVLCRVGYAARGDKLVNVDVRMIDVWRGFLFKVSLLELRKCKGV